MVSALKQQNETGGFSGTPANHIQGRLFFIFTTVSRRPCFVQVPDLLGGVFIQTNGCLGHPN